MNNEEYLKHKNVAKDTTTYAEFMEVLESYGEKQWWVSEDPKTRAYYQTLDQNHFFILPYRHYINDLTVLLGREVQLYEIRMSNKEDLQQEVEQVWQGGSQ